jgi:hypothetical protein
MSGTFINSIQPPVFTSLVTNPVQQHVEKLYQENIAADNYAKLLDPITDELAKHADITEQQFKGIVIQSSRNINDDTIIKSMGITAQKLAVIRSSEKYKEALALKTINIVTNNLSADIKRDKLELIAIDELMSRMSHPANTLETMEILAIARGMNQAKRRYGIDNNTSFQPNGNGDINVTQNIVNLSIPSIVLDRLKRVSSGASAVKTEDQYITQYGNSKAQEIDIKRVSEVLGVDLSKPNAREATISETYNSLFEDNTVVGDNVSILEGEG